ncbi:PAS domain-containing protein [Candidatus Ozemobacteraceae bacterium]|nr:PAS domain-containing protein [Candidatus Ozemobacteraceae bacterium]
MKSDARFEDTCSWNIAKESPFMRALWNSTTDNMFVVAITPDEQLILQDFNPAQASVFGLSVKDLVGKSLETILPPENFKTVKRNYLNCVNLGRPVSYEENVALDGGIRHWFTLLVPLPDETGKRHIIFGIARETTELHRLSDSLQMANTSLEERVETRTAELAKAINQLEAEMAKLKAAEDNIKVLRGMLPICSICKKVRDDNGYWMQIEQYIRDHSEAEFSHGICAECATKHYRKFMG